MKILGLFNKVAAVKSGVEGFFSALSFLLKAKDRLDDDLDGDGKSQLVNILERVQVLEDRVVAYGKELFAEAKVFGAGVLSDIQEIVRLVDELRAHVMEK